MECESVGGILVDISCMLSHLLLTVESSDIETTSVHGRCRQGCRRLTRWLRCFSSICKHNHIDSTVFTAFS